MKIYPRMVLKRLDRKESREAEETSEHPLTGYERVVEVDVSYSKAVIIRMDGEKALFPRWENCSELERLLESGQIEEVSDPYVEDFVADEDIPQTYREIRDRAFEAVEVIVSLVPAEDPYCLFDKNRRWRILERAEQTLNITKKTLWGYLRRHWQGGMNPRALLPHFQLCGGDPRKREHTGVKLGRPTKLKDENNKSTGINVTPSIIRNLLKGHKKFFVNGNCRTLQDAYDQTLLEFFKVTKIIKGSPVKVLPAKEELPSYDQFNYWTQKLEDRRQTRKARAGSDVYNQNLRAITGDATAGVFGPGSEYQIDATLADILLLSMFWASRIIGRPILYLVVDVFSRLIAGFSLSLEGPSWDVAKLALENAMTSKVEFCARYGIYIEEKDWPSDVKPVTLTADWGEMAGNQSDSLVKTMGVRIDNATVRRPDWKPFVERDFYTLKQKGIQWEPGAVDTWKKRSGRRYKLDAEYDLWSITAYMIRLILEYNKTHLLTRYRLTRHMIEKKVERTPLSLWNYGREYRTGSREKWTVEAVRKALLHRATASITAQCVMFEGMRYKSPWAEKNGLHEEARAGKVIHNAIAHDIHNVNTIHLVLANGKRLEPCHLDEVDAARFKDKTLYDVQDFLAMQRRQDQETKRNMLIAKDERQDHARGLRTETKIRNQALPASTPDSPSMPRTMRERRKLEKEKMRRQPRQQQTNTHATQEPTEEVTSRPAKGDSYPASGYLPPDSHDDDLRNLFD